MTAKQIAEVVSAIDAARLAGLTEIPMGPSAFAPARAFTTGRDAKGRFATPSQWLALCVTARGHWFRSDDERDDFHNDTLCRGCGTGCLECACTERRPRPEHRAHATAISGGTR